MHHGALISKRFAVAAVLTALTFFLLGLVAARAGATTGGVGAGGTSGSAQTSSQHGPRTERAGTKYTRIWKHFRRADRRWAHSTARCESGGDPHALGAGGRYRGAFQFTRSTWKTSPKSPGGDPIRYSYKTQAVVAVLLKHRVGTGPWPVCG